jgi:hypothetical protein
VKCFHVLFRSCALSCHDLTYRDTRTKGLRKTEKTSIVDKRSCARCLQNVVVPETNAISTVEFI